MKGRSYKQTIATTTTATTKTFTLLEKRISYKRRNVIKKMTFKQIPKGDPIRKNNSQSIIIKFVGKYFKVKNNDTQTMLSDIPQTMAPTMLS